MHLLRLAYFSRQLIHELVATEALDFDYRRNGKLVIFSDAASFDGAKRTLDFQRAFGSEQHALDGEQCLALEPALQAIRHRVSSAGSIRPRKMRAIATIFAWVWKACFASAA